jgi:TonB family protein
MEMPAKRWFWLAGVASLLLAGVSHATPAGAPAGPLVSGKDEPASIAQDPGAAPGQVVVRCQVTADRTVDHCRVTNETPAGHGLGEAALRMVQQFKIKAETFKPEMVGATVSIPINFAPDPEADDMPSGVAASPATPPR